MRFLNRLFTTIFLIFKICGVFCQSNSIVLKIDSLNKRGHELRYSDKKNALYNINLALTLSKVYSDKNGESRSYVILGNIFLNNGEYEKSNKYYLMSLKIRESLKDSIGIASVYNNLGKLYFEKGELDRALNFFQTAQSISARQNDQNGLGHCYSNLANLFDDQNEHQEAIAYNEKAMVIQRRLMEDNRTQEDSQNYANTTYNLAERYFNLQNDSTASRYLAEALPLFKSVGDTDGEALVHYFNGSILSRQRKYEAAELEFAKSEKIYLDSEGEGYSLGIVYLNAYEPKIGLGKSKEALNMLRKASQWLSTEESVNEKQQLSTAFAEVFHALGQLDSAWFYQKQAIALTDSIYNTEKSNQYTKWRTQFDTQQKEQDLLEEKLVSEKATARSRTFLALFLAALAVAGSIFGYFRHRQRTAAVIAKQNEQIHAQEVEELLKNQEIKSISAMLEGQEVERVRIAKDLHDRLGSMLTTVKWGFDSYIEDKADKANMEPLVKANHMLDDAYQEVRRIAHDMVSGVLTKFGLAPAVQELCTAINESGRLEIKLVTFGMEARLDNKVEITLYRTIQELMSNILKHAKATKVTVQLNRLENEMNVSVEDNGIGFNPESTRKGMGLKNIEARVQSMDGSVFFDSGKGNGTSVMIEVPV